MATEKTPLVDPEATPSTTPEEHERNGNLILVLLLGCTCLTATVSGTLFYSQGHATAIVVAVWSDVIDIIAYLLSLACSLWNRYGDAIDRESVDVAVGAVSTGLLGATGVKIVVMAYWSVRCDYDTSYSSAVAGDVPCAFLEERPRPRLVLLTALVMLCPYVPLAGLALCKPGILAGYSPKENINKASALLHAVSGCAEQFVVALAALLMLVMPDKSVEVDAGASCLVVSILVGFSVLMWQKYLGSEKRATIVRLSIARASLRASQRQAAA